MSHDKASLEVPRIERILAGLLQYGTWLASIIIAVGLALQFSASVTQAHLSSPGHMMITSGITLFILLPILRIVLMLALFILERDHRFVVISALVLTIIAISYWIGAVE